MSYWRYALKENPYETDALLSHRSRKDSERFLAIHPAVDERKVVRDLRSSINGHRGTFYAVVGTSGSGRTAVASRIFRLYNGLRAAQARRNGDPPPKTAAYERLNDGNLAPRQVCRGILLKAADKVSELGTDFENGPAEKLADRIRKLRSDYTIDDLGSIAQKFVKGVYALSGGLTCLIENVATVEIFRAVRSMFAETEAAVICTVRTEQSAAVLGALQENELTGDARIELDKLTPDKAIKLAALRWRIWKGGGDMPFNDVALLHAFTGRPRTVGKTLGTLGFMIRSKLANYGGDSLWPTDTNLGFDQVQIDANFELFDEGRW